MYGRCETDPFDQAVDVCGSCYGEFCAACLVTTKGRKHRICKECALIASGVRPGAKPLIRGSKKTAGARRKALRDAPEAPAPLEFYDGPKEPDDGSGGEDASSEAEPGSTGAELPPLPPLGPAAAQVGATEDEPARPRSAIEQLEEMSRRAPVETPPEPPTAPAPTRPVPISHPVAAVSDVDEMPDLTANPFAGAPAPTGPATPVPTPPPTRAPAPPAALNPVLPARRGADDLPRRRSTVHRPAERDEVPEAASVATADRPAPLPRRRSTLRPDQG